MFPERRIKNSQEAYKEFKCPNGHIVRLTKDEFQKIVDWFVWLDKQDRLQEMKSKEIKNGSYKQN
jgi:hypothetical protein